MSLLLKNALVIDKNSPSHSKPVNLLVEEGKIVSFNGKNAEKVIDLAGKVVTYGWFDLNANFSDPGHEYREDVMSGSELAQAGGFTDVCLMPGTFPPIERKGDVDYLSRRRSDLVNIYVCGALSEALKGENLTEILDLHSAGAICFSDGDEPIWNTELLLKALQYTSDINVPIFQNPRDIHLSANTHMHEGLHSTNLGLRGEPAFSEKLMIQRDLEVLRYGGGRLHFSRISTADSVHLIRAAKAEGLAVSCDVGIHHLIFTDELVGDFDTNYKSIPHYRSEIDRMALLEGIKDGAVDAICSNHRPLDGESKQLEYDLSEPGNISLQTFYPTLVRISKEVPFEILIDRVVNGPRKVLMKDPVVLEEGSEAKLVILDPKAVWNLNSETNLSKSKNSPFWGQELTGKVVGIVNGRFFECDDL